MQRETLAPVKSRYGILIKNWSACERKGYQLVNILELPIYPSYALERINMD